MSEFKPFFESLARQAGEIIRPRFDRSMDCDWKKDESPVTEADRLINALVIDAVSKTFPGHSVLGEEGTSVGESDAPMWVCDPIDGTRPFSHGVPTCTFSLAVCDKGNPFVGLIYDPFLDRIFYAEKGRGATQNDCPIVVSSDESLNRSMISIDGPQSTDFYLARQEMESRGAATIQYRSVLYAGMLTASGKFRATVFTGDSPWDGAALKILIDEAGGKMTSLKGAEQRYDGAIDGYVASNGLVHDEVLQILAQYSKLRTQ